MHDKVLESTWKKSSVTSSLVNQSPLAPKNLEVCTVRVLQSTSEVLCWSTAEVVLGTTAEVLERYCRSTAEVLQMHDKVLESTR